MLICTYIWMIGGELSQRQMPAALHAVCSFSSGTGPQVSGLPHPEFLSCLRRFTCSCAQIAVPVQVWLSWAALVHFLLWPLIPATVQQPQSQTELDASSPPLSLCSHSVLCTTSLEVLMPLVFTLGFLNHPLPTSPLSLFMFGMFGTRVCKYSE